ncbi:MAG: hypothetical protein WED07_14015 [Candidatus Freyarchaeum deiterrae]
MGNSESEVENLLKSIFRIESELMLSIYSVDKDFASRVGASLGKYEFGYLIEAFQNSADAVAKWISFFDNYIEAFVKGLEFFSNLVFALGIKEYSEVLSRRNRVEQIIQPDKIDLDFLKFQVRNTEELIYPPFERSIADIIQKFELLREMSAFLESDRLHIFIEGFEKQKEKMDKIQKRIKLCFSIFEKATDISICINQISEIINELIFFADDLRSFASHLNQLLGGKLELSVNNFKQISGKIKQLSQDLIILVKCRAKGAEYLGRSFIQILTMLWGSEENARKKFQSLVRSETPLENLIPPNLSLEDLEFGLVQARNQILLVDRAHKRVKGTVKAMREAADYLNSPVLAEYYEIIVKEIEIIDNYFPKYNQKIIELQNSLYGKSVEPIEKSE